MAIFIFILGILFVAAGFGGLIASLDLLPTEIGMLYVICGAIAICAGGITIAIGALIHRLSAMAAIIERGQSRDAWALSGATPAAEVARREGEAPSFAAAEPAFEDLPPLEAEAEEDPALEQGDPLDDDEAVNENRAGRLPTMSEIEHALSEPEPAAKLVGRYSAGGASYMIFSDGSIEAETEGGAFKFASMSEFKAYLAGDR